MPAFIEAGRLEGLAPGKGAVVTTGNSSIALFKIDEVIFAIEAWCLRCGACLAEGTIVNGIVACRDCAWRYEVATGSVVGLQALRLNTFGVELVGGRLIIAGA